MRIGQQQKNFQIHHQFGFNKLRDEMNSKPVMEKVKIVVKVVFSILLSLALLCINPAIFFVSFVIGVAFSNAIQKAIDKIKIFVMNYKLPVIAASIVGGVFLLPIVLATGTVIWSAFVGSYLSKKAQESFEKKNK